MEKENKQTAGSLRISEEVLATIATKAATSIEGVAGLIGEKSPEKKGPFRLPPHKSVRIELTDDDAALDLYLAVKYGFNIRNVSEAVQQAVKDDVQTMTGVTVSKVNIHVEDIVFEESQS